MYEVESVHKNKWFWGKQKPATPHGYRLFGGESGSRTHVRVAPNPVFKTGAISQLCHLSMLGFLPSGRSEIWQHFLATLLKIVLIISLNPDGIKDFRR